MKTRSYLIALLFLTSCVGMPDNNTETNKDAPVPDHTDTLPSIAPEGDALQVTARQYGEGIISGRITPGDDERTLAWLDSLQSADPGTRNFAFQVYKAMSSKSDGALSEAIAPSVKDYLYAYPKEFLSNFEKLDENGKAATRTSIAFELYASGTDYKKDRNAYFGMIHHRCMGCTEPDKILLKSVRAKVEAAVSEMAG